MLIFLHDSVSPRSLTDFILSVLAEGLGMTNR